jgi:hypothetical protein
LKGEQYFCCNGLRHEVASAEEKKRERLKRLESLLAGSRKAA